MSKPLISCNDMKVALPDTRSPKRLDGLDAMVEVYRDGYGIPHVKGKSVHDAIFGQGFATAQDRLWQMDYDRRRAYGRWAEYAGESAFEQDKMMRHFLLAPTVKQDYEAVNSDTRAMLDAYAAGVNAFIDTTTSLPVEYSLVHSLPEPWTPWDCLAVFKVRHILMGVFEGKLWRTRLMNTLGSDVAADLFKGYQPGHLLIVPPGAQYEGPVLDGVRELSRGQATISWYGEEGGSNSWVLDGKRTASRKPLLAGDPHRALDTPNVYYQNHIACKEFDVIGLSFPGFPGFPHFGHNAYAAWCVTHAMNDYQDLYVERFNPSDPTQYEFQGEWRQAQVSREVIGVRGLQPVEIDVTMTHHGTIITGDLAKGHGIAFKYTATAEPNLGSEAILPMLMASSTEELDESMRVWVDPCNNFLIADVSGNIGYINRGKVPIRSMANAWLPVPGWTGKHEWDGFIPFEELPRSRNPDTGYIVTANNRIVGKDYPYYLALDFAPEYRARRIVERLKNMRDATVKDMADVHAERGSIPAQTYKVLLAALTPVDGFFASAVERLQEWDGNMDKDSVAPTIYSAFRIRLHRIVLEHLLGPLTDEAFTSKGRGVPGYLSQLGSMLVRMAREDDISLLPPGSTWETTLRQALMDSLSDLRCKLGDDLESWQWGRVHHTRPRHTLSDSFPSVASLLDPPSTPMAGDGDTPQAGSYSTEEPFVMTGMSVARYVFDLGDWEKSAWVTPLGSSGHPGSTHYADQLDLWSEVELIPMLYCWDRISSNAESHQLLEPNY